eukprot:scaffold24459_cov72-Phaeocystis_antarctica.AAC.2
MTSQPCYTGTKALVLEWIRPAAGQEVHTLDIPNSNPNPYPNPNPNPIPNRNPNPNQVHTLDILTVAQPDGEIELVRTGLRGHATSLPRLASELWYRAQAARRGRGMPAHGGGE